MEEKGRGLRGSTTSKLHHTHSQVLKHKRNTAKGPPLVQPSPSFQHVPGALSRPLLAEEGLRRSVLVIVKSRNRGIVWLGYWLRSIKETFLPEHKPCLGSRMDRLPLGLTVTPCHLEEGRMHRNRSPTVKRCLLILF